MASGRDPREQIDFVLRRHFSASFTSSERAALVDDISQWDAENPGLDQSARFEAWLDIARRSVITRS